MTEKPKLLLLLICLIIGVILLFYFINPAAPDESFNGFSEDNDTIIICSATSDMKALEVGVASYAGKEGIPIILTSQTIPFPLNEWIPLFKDKANIIDEFFKFAQAEQQKEAQALIDDENLNVDSAKRYILTSLKREYASENGTELNDILPKMSPLNPEYLTKKQTVFQKIANFVEKFKGIGGSL